MNNKETVAFIEKCLQPIVEEHGFELYNIEFVKEGQNWYFRVYIDKEAGVAIEDCELISRATEKLLDEKDPIKQPYILEVSSAGLDRPLKKESDFKRYTGKIIDIKLYKAFEKQKEFQGTLLGLENNMITIKMESGKEMVFAREDVASCKLAVFF